MKTKIAPEKIRLYSMALIKAQLKATYRYVKEIHPDTTAVTFSLSEYDEKQPVRICTYIHSENNDCAMYENIIDIEREENDDDEK